MKRDAFLGVDVGGTGAKAGVYDLRGRPLGNARVGYAPRVWPDGRVEIPVRVIEEAARSAARKAIAASRARIVGLCVSSQGQTFVSLDDRGRALHPAILWYDGRAKAQADALAARGVRVEAISSAAKILWLQGRDPSRMARARQHLLLPDYLSFRLTGRAVTDPITASSSGLVGDEALAYSAEKLSATAIPVDRLAAIQASGTPIGTVLPAAARAWGLAPGALLVTGTNDQFAGAIGAGNTAPGILSVTTGTCLALVTLAESLPVPPPPGLLHGAFPVKPYRYALAYARTAGVLFDWFRSNFCPQLDLDDLDRLAARVPPGPGNPVALPDFEGVVSPSPAARARGAFLNLGLPHGTPHLFRALRESVAFVFRENVEFLERLGLRAGVVRAIGGGAGSGFLVQLKADVLGRPIEVPVVREAATLGAAMLAATGCGAFGSVDSAAKALYRARRVFEPRRQAVSLYAPLYERFLSLRRGVHGLDSRGREGDPLRP